MVGNKEIELSLFDFQSNFSIEVSRKLGLKQKVCWLFKRKVMKAMESSGKFHYRLQLRWMKCS